MSNLETNLLILKKLKKEIENNPDMRFQQLLWYTGIIEKVYNDQDRIEIEDKFYETSEITYKKFLERLELHEIDKLEDLHKHCMHNKEELKQYNNCSCFYCQKSFLYKDIKEWTDNNTTAICPNCKVDSVIATKFIDTKNTLKKLYKKYFE